MVTLTASYLHILTQYKLHIQATHQRVSSVCVYNTPLQDEVSAVFFKYFFLYLSPPLSRVQLSVRSSLYYFIQEEWNLVTRLSYSDWDRSEIRLSYTSNAGLVGWPAAHRNKHIHTGGEINYWARESIWGWLACR